MSILVADLTVDQGCDYSQPTLPWIVSGSFPDLSNAVVFMTIRVNPLDNIPVLALSNTPNANGSSVVGTVNGTVVVSIRATDSAPIAIDQSPLEYEIVVLTNGQRVPFQRGRILLNASIVH